MIQVEHLSRRYGDFFAINDISFSVAKGEVLGFLGPNGAGKSTTMRILSGCIGATSGRALIGGKDVTADPQGVKRSIGYLPEVPPVYGTMAVADYVAFAAKIKGVSDVAGATERAMARVGLSGVRDRIIENLSKGYRQRVGIAQALVHDPEVLILDEPTSGLDPAQRREIRDLLHELAEGARTVILSTHVLGEIEAVCERVVIINKGQVVGSGAISELSGAARQVRLKVARPDEALEAELRSMPGIASLTPMADGAYRLGTAEERREAIAAAAVRCGLLELTPEAGLEEAYLRLTQTGGAA